MMKRILSTLAFWFLCVHLFAQMPAMVLPVGHTNRIYEAHFSPDGKKVITVSKDKTAKLWDAASGYLLADLRGHNAAVEGARFSPDGQYILTTSMDHEAENSSFRIWDATTGQLRNDLAGTPGWVTQYGFSADGKMILAASDSVKCWNTVNGKFRYAIAANGGNVQLLSFSPDGQWMLYATADKTLRVCDAATGKPRFVCTGFTAPVLAVFFSSGRNELFAATQNETIIWDPRTWTRKAVIKGSIPQHDLFRFSPDGQMILSADYSPEVQSVYLWEAATRKMMFKKSGRQLPDQTGHAVIEGRTNGGLRGTAATLSGHFLAAVLNTAYHTRSQFGTENDKQALCWDITRDTPPVSLEGHTNAISYMEFSPDGTRLLTSSYDGTAKIWDAVHGILLADLCGHTFNAADMTFISPVSDTAAGAQLVTTSDDGSLHLWDLATMRVLKTFNGPAEKIFSVQYCRGGQKLLTGTKEGDMTVWDLPSGRSLRIEHVSDVVIDPTSEVDLDEITLLVKPVLSPDGKLVLSGIHGATAKMYDAVTGRLLWELKNEKLASLAFVRFSPDGSKVMAGWNYYDNWVDSTLMNCLVADAHTGSVLYKMVAEQAEFSPDGNKIIRAALLKPMQMLDASTGKLLYVLSKGGNNINARSYPYFSADGRFILAYDWQKRTAGLWDATSGSFIRSLQDAPELYRAGFSPDAGQVFILSPDGYATIWNTMNGDRKPLNSGQNGKIQDVAFTPDGRQVLTTASDFTGKLWDAETGNCIATFFAVDSTGYFSQLPDGHYQTTNAASKQLHYVTPELVPVSFEQLDVKFNRPDLVLQAIGRTDSNVTASYYKAYLKRLKKLGISPNAFDSTFYVPEADIINRGSIAYDQHQRSLKLNLHATDAHQLLDRFNIWVNEVPVYGQKGADLRHRNSHELDTTVSISLSRGMNRIEFSVTNVSVAESFRKPLLVNNTLPGKDTAKLWFIGIGTDRFADSTHNLQYCSKDIRDLAGKLSTRYAGRIVIDTFFNERVTLAAISGVKAQLMQTGTDDKVVLAFSGHGLLSKQLDYYLSAYDVDFRSPEKNGLPYELMESLLDSIPARKKLMLIDACHSGEVDKESKLSRTGNQISGAKGGEVRNLSTGAGVGLKNSFDMMQEIFVNVSRSTGATVISAAAGTELALEKSELQNGVFTYSLMEILDHSFSIRVSELRKKAGDRVMELTRGRQQPTARSEPVLSDWEL